VKVSGLQVYVCELGRCLLKLKDSSDPVLEMRMKELTVEAPLWAIACCATLLATRILPLVK